jgi:proline dehydrogenase
MKPSQKVSFDDTAVAFASRSNTELRKMYWLFATMNNNFLVKTGGPTFRNCF